LGRIGTEQGVRDSKTILLLGGGELDHREGLTENPGTEIDDEEEGGQSKIVLKTQNPRTKKRGVRKKNRGGRCIG